MFFTGFAEQRTSWTSLLISTRWALCLFSVSGSFLSSVRSVGRAIMTSVFPVSATGGPRSSGFSYAKSFSFLPLGIVVNGSNISTGTWVGSSTLVSMVSRACSLVLATISATWLSLTVGLPGSIILDPSNITLVVPF